MSQIPFETFLKHGAIGSLILVLILVISSKRALDSLSGAMPIIIILLVGAILIAEVLEISRSVLDRGREAAQADAQRAAEDRRKAQLQSSAEAKDCRVALLLLAHDASDAELSVLRGEAHDASERCHAHLLSIEAATK